MSTEPLTSSEPTSQYYVVTIDDGYGNDIEAQLNIVLTDEGVVFDLYDRNGDTLLKSGYLFAQDIADEHVR